MLATMRQLSEVKSTTVVRRYGILTIFTPSNWEGPRGAKTMNTANALVMTIDLTSDTWYELVNGAPSHHPVPYRSGIHVALAEISHMSHLGPGRPCWPYPRTWWVGRVCRADYGTHDPTHATQRRPMDPPGPWGAGVR